MHSHSFERIASGLYLEGLTVERNGDGGVWYSDVIGGGIHRVSPEGVTRSFNTDRRWTGGLIVNDDGKVLSSGAGGIMWTDPESGRSGWLIEAIDGEAVNGINEMAPDGQGGMWFGTIDLAAVARGQTPGPAGLYHLDAIGSARATCGGLGFTNGLALSPDGRSLYCNESFDGTYVHDVASDGSLGNRRKFLSKYDCDGMAIDAEGNVWITGFNSAEIVRITPSGDLLEPFSTPGGAVTQLRFGGADMRDVYFTTVPADAGEKLAVGDLPSKDVSFLIRGRSDVPGHAVPGVCFTVSLT